MPVEIAGGLLVGDRQGAVGGDQRHVEVQPRHGAADHRQIGAQPDADHHVGPSPLETGDLRRHVLGTLVVGFRRHDGTARRLQFLGDHVGAGHAVGRALVNQPRLLELLGDVAAEHRRLDVVLQREGEDVRARLAAVRVGDGRGLRHRVHVGTPVGGGHLDHRQRRAAARRADDGDQFLVVEQPAHVLHRAVGHELVVEQHRQLDLLAVDAALGVPLLDGEFDAAPPTLAILVVGAGQGRGHADLDGVLRGGGPGGQGERRGQRDGGPEQADDGTTVHGAFPSLMRRGL